MVEKHPRIQPTRKNTNNKPSKNSAWSHPRLLLVLPCVVLVAYALTLLASVLGLSDKVMRSIHFVFLSIVMGCGIVGIRWCQSVKNRDVEITED